MMPARALGMKKPPAVKHEKTAGGA